MTWPTPDLLPPPAIDDDHVPASPPPETPEDDRERRSRSGLPAATWIALLGGALVLIAAASIVVSNWDAIGRTFRVLGLVAGTVGLISGSERLRQLAPTTSNIVAHVGTFLTASVGIAALSLVGVTWPGCLLAGGLLSLAATVWQADRWRPELFRVAQVGAIALAATGLAELTGTTGGLIAALAALVLLIVGAERRAAGLAVLAVLSPVLSALADAGIGAGTFERAGLVGERLSWSGPTVGLLAAMVLAVVAQRRRNNGLMLTAVAAPVFGVVTGLAAIDGSAIAWWCVPALIVIAAELGWWMLPGDRFRTEIARGVDAISATIACIALAAPYIVTELQIAPTDHPWAVPSAVSAFAVLLSTYRWNRADAATTDLGIASALALGVAMIVALGANPIVVTVIGVLAVVAGAAASRRLHRLAIYVPAFWTVVSIDRLTTDVGSVSWIVGLAAATAVFGLVAVTRARLAADAEFAGRVEMTLVVIGGSLLATTFVDGPTAAAALVGVAVVGAMVALAERRWILLQVATTTLVAVFATDAALRPDGLDDRMWIGVGAVALAFAVVAAAHRSALVAHAAAATAVLTVTAYVAGQAIAPADVIAGAMCAVAVLTGLALTVQRRTALDSAAITAGLVLAGSSSLPVHPAWVSGIWVVLGLQGICYGVAMRHRLLTVGGAIAATVAVLSWWSTTGFGDWFRELIAPADITIGDLWMLVATVSALTVGWALRRVVELNSWLAYGCGLAIGGMWLIGVQLERNPVWVVPAALTLGIVAAGLGAWHRLAAPLVGGTVITATTTFIATGSDLSAMPTWSWLAAGGLALLGTAVLIERTSKQGTNLHDLVDRWG